MTREQVMTALWALLTPLVQSTSLAPTSGKPLAFASRRFKLWSDVPSTNKPALFMTEPEEDDQRPDLSEPNTEIFTVYLWIFIDAQDESVVPIIAMNNLIDTVRTALRPDAITGRQTLGGLVIDVSVIGKTMKDPGDLDGNGVARIPLRIIVPAF